MGRWEAEELQRCGWDRGTYVQLKAEVQRLADLLQAQQRAQQQQRPAGGAAAGAAEAGMEATGGDAADERQQHVGPQP